MSILILCIIGEQSQGINKKRATVKVTLKIVKNNLKKRVFKRRMQP